MAENPLGQHAQGQPQGSNNSNIDDEVIPDAKSLPDPPTDAISKLAFLTSSVSSCSSSSSAASFSSLAPSLLASTSWDGALRLHDCNAMECKLSQTASIGPLLSLAVAEEEYIFVGGLGGSILRMNLERGGGGGRAAADTASAPKVVWENVGTQVVTAAKQSSSSSAPSFSSAACSCLVTIPSSPPLLASAGWHGKFHLWDLRQQPSSSASGPAITIDLPGKAFTMDHCNGRIVVGCSGRRTCLLDVRKKNPIATITTSNTGNEEEEEEDANGWIAELVLDAESSQKHQTRCIKFFPDGQSIAVGSVEGRVAVESVLVPEASSSAESSRTTMMKKVYAFKCHREGDLVYPVNCIDFHPIYGTFATGGCDGTVVTWDGVNRKRLTSFSFPTSIASLCFNHNGSLIAVASSYTFEDGERQEYPRDEIYIRRLLESECAPKQPSSSQ